MSFYIKVNDDRPGSKSTYYGVIRIEDFEEEFSMSLRLWTLEQYEKHWLESILRIVDGIEKSCLITSFAKPSTDSHLVWWPMYREGGKVYIQNQLLFFDQLTKQFDPSNPYESILARKRITEKGEEISEWETSLDSLEAFLKKKSS